MSGAGGGVRWRDAGNTERWATVRECLARGVRVRAAGLAAADRPRHGGGGRGGHALHNPAAAALRDAAGRPGRNRTACGARAGAPSPAPPQAVRAQAAAGWVCGASGRRVSGPTPPPPPARGSLTFRVALDHHARAPLPARPRGLRCRYRRRTVPTQKAVGRVARRSHTAAPRPTLAPRSRRPALRALRGCSRPSRTPAGASAAAPPRPSSSPACALPDSAPTATLLRWLPGTLGWRAAVPAPARIHPRAAHAPSPRPVPGDPERRARSLGAPWLPTRPRPALPPPPAGGSASAARDRLASGGGEECGASPPSATRSLPYTPQSAGVLFGSRRLGRLPRGGAALASASPHRRPGPAVDFPPWRETSAGTDHA